MTIGVVVFPGSNCDRDVRWATEGCLGIPTRYLWHEERDYRKLLDHTFVRFFIDFYLATIFIKNPPHWSVPIIFFGPNSRQGALIYVSLLACYIVSVIYV